ncbi:MAG: ATP-binding protein [Cyanobacteria bacterium P01_B01_bin.77]
MLFLLLSFATPVVAQTSPPVDATPANILIIHSYDINLSWTAHVVQGIDEGFAASRHSVTIYHEFLDAKRHPALAHRIAFLDYLRKKYQDMDLTLLMVADDPGLNLLLANRETHFPELPVVFMGLNHIREELLSVPWMTGVFETHSIKETLLEAQRQTQTNNVVILSDSTETGKANQQRIASMTTSTPNFPEIAVVSNATPQTIAEQIGQYPHHWPIFLAGQLRSDKTTDGLLSFEETVQLLRSQLPNPIYTDSFMHLGHGAVGGKILEGSYHAQQSVELAEKILDGIPVPQIKAITHSENHWIFDAEELHRFNISQNSLPIDSILINTKPSFYKQYQQLVGPALAVFIFGILTIFVLLDAIRRQKQSEITLEHRVTERTNKLSETLRELKQTQAQLIQTEKLSSLGQLVSGIAHEFNNPLTFITGNIEILKDYGKDLLQLVRLYEHQASEQQKAADAPSAALRYSQDIDLGYIQADMPKIFQSINKGTERIEAIIRSLQSFASSDEQGIKPTDLNKSLDNTLMILRSRIGNKIEVIKHYDKLPLVHCEPGAINQVFMQILLNAIETLETLDKDTLRQISIHTCTQEENWITISIKDTGAGIPSSIREKIFDPFFTTKSVGEGTGLGLAVAYQHTQQHGGHLTFSPNAPKGSIFTIQLPFTI